MTQPPSAGLEAAATSTAPNAALKAATVTVAAVQAQPEPGAVAGNAVLGARLIGRAAVEGARITVLPELFLCAYHPPVLYSADVATTHVDADDSGRVDDPRLDPVRDACRDSRTVAVLGAAVRHPDGRRTCATLVVDPQGRTSAPYDKQNLWGPDEKALFAAGDRGATVTVDGWRLALGICYDGCFPEHGRSAAVAGADAYLCPAGYLLGSEHRRDVYYAARALDNTMYVAFANSVGGTPPLRFNGGAALYDPQGRVLVRAPDQGEVVVTATFEAAELDRVRQVHTMLVDRPRADERPRRVIDVS